jgi:hypothetical protein
MKQSFLCIRHKVNNYPKWKAVFDSLINFRRESGEKSYHIFHPENEPDNLYLLFLWDNLDNARTFVNSDELKNAMINAEVTDMPEIHFFNKIAEGKL